MQDYDDLFSNRGRGMHRVSDENYRNVMSSAANLISDALSTGMTKERE